MIDIDRLMDLIDSYAESRHINGNWLYNEKSFAARSAVIDACKSALSRIAELEAVGAGGVQALSAAPVGWKLVPEDATDAMVRATDAVNFANVDTDATMHDVWHALLAASPTPPAEQPFVDQKHEDLSDKRVCASSVSDKPGAHLIWSRPGGVLTRYQIEPADAALLAAAQRMHDAMMDAMQKADRWEPDEELKGKRAKAWEAYKAIAGEESTLRIKGASMQDVVQAGIDVLIQSAKNNTRQP